MGARQGRARFVPRQPQLVAGVRAGPGFPVGYLGSLGVLAVLNVGDPLPVEWSARWDSGALIVQGADVVIDHYRINSEVTFTGVNPTMTNCLITPVVRTLFGVTVNGSGKGVLDISDTTVVCVANVGAGTYAVNGISSDSGLRAVRCDVSGSGDGIHMVAAPTTPSKISQCYVHDLAFINEEQHLDGIQVFNYSSAPGFYTIEHTFIAETRSLIGTPMNSASTAGPPSVTAEPLSTAIYDNNCFPSGLYHLRINFRHQNTVVTNNNVGTLGAGEFGVIAVEEPAAISTWTNNRTGTGLAGTGTLIPQP